MLVKGRFADSDSFGKLEEIYLFTERSSAREFRKGDCGNAEEMINRYCREIETSRGCKLEESHVFLCFRQLVSRSLASS